MATRIALFVVPAAVVVGLVLLLNAVDAGTGVAVASLSLVTVASGVALGLFADRLPQLARPHRGHPLVPHRID
jgi:hypothetical protein